MDKICEYCGRGYYCTERSRRYCSKDCSDKGRTKRQRHKCVHCGKMFERKRSDSNTKSGYTYCSRKCLAAEQGVDGKYAPKVYEGSTGTYRSRCLKAKGATCVNCGYAQGQRMLDVDHIDGNRKNHALDNLQVLCVWCHALKTRKNWKD